ncbi:MAG TPA: DUF4350 domain-containing protein, partial [Gemmatimonadaceae bacterium]
MAERLMQRWLRPHTVLPVLAGAILVAMLFTPVGDEDRSPQFLTTRSSSLNGAKGLRELFDRLGRHTSERLVPFRPPLDSSAVYFVLGNVVDMSATETHALLDAVRSGARAVVVPERNGSLADSLGIRASERSAIAFHAVDDSVFGLYDQVDTLHELFGAYSARTFHRYLEASPASDSDRAATWPPEATSFLDVRTVGGHTHPEIAIMTLSHGDVVMIADPSFLRNDIMRRTAGAVLAVRIVERIDRSGRAPLVFDEFHQGFGSTDSPLNVLADALTLTRPG